jgi:4-hydroxybenzoate polyprenyltransferase
VKNHNNKALALINSSHPIPCFAVALFSGLFGIGSGLPVETCLIIFTAVLLQQISVGLSNDWIDFNRDKAAGRIDKPTVNGLVRVAELRAGSLIAAGLALVVAFSLGLATGGLMILMLIVGWSYNLGMKLNWSSAVPYAIGFGIIPIFVGLSAPEPFWVDTWVVAVAALLGVSAHFANVLPDILEDKLTGVQALPHILGQRASAAVIAVTALVATVLVVTQSNHLAPLVAVIGLVLTILLVGIASLLSLRPKPPRVVFPLLILASLVNVVLLMLGA